MQGEKGAPPATTKITKVRRWSVLRPARCATQVLGSLLSFLGVLATLSGAQAQLVAWGANSYGQTTVPPGLIGAVAIAGGNDHALGLKGDGSVVAWGGERFCFCY